LITSFGNQKALGEVEELEVAAAEHEPARFAVSFQVTSKPRVRGDVEIPKPVMAVVVLLADEHSRGKSRLMDQLSHAPKKRPKEIDVDAA
jgi:hypothetical protein